MIGSGRRYGEITGSTATLAHLTGGADLTRPVPTCPDWPMRQLITHVGAFRGPIPRSRVPGGAALLDVLLAATPF